MKSREIYARRKISPPTVTLPVVVGKVASSASSKGDRGFSKNIKSAKAVMVSKDIQQPWVVLPMHPNSSIVSAEDLLKIIDLREEEIETVRFQPPKLGDSHYGFFQVNWNARKTWADLLDRIEHGR